MSERNGVHPDGAKTPAIQSITVEGLKSIGTRCTVEVRPLTLLAGANSSGKSSLMQGLLLLKQTLEAPYDPGALLINGPNVKFTNVEQMFTRGFQEKEHRHLRIRIDLVSNGSIETVYARGQESPLQIIECQYRTSSGEMTLKPGLAVEEILLQAQPFSSFVSTYLMAGAPQANAEVHRDRCFLRPIIFFSAINVNVLNLEPFMSLMSHIIHIPGLRGNPERSYPLAATGSPFHGTFERYSASILAHWSANHDERLQRASENLRRLGLTWKVEAVRKDDISIELRVARLPKPSEEGDFDLVNIADVGFGVSQTLPIVVALLAAREGQLVYIEQPEIHLHPRAQVAMAQLLVDAADRGVRVVVETHSSLLLLGVQSLVADGKLSPDKVILHWFQRDEKGLTDVTTRELDEDGRFGDWPVDFDDVALEAQMHYLNASEQRRAKV